jgi:hypothetical protein
MNTLDIKKSPWQKAKGAVDGKIEGECRFSSRRSALVSRREYVNENF